MKIIFIILASLFACSGTIFANDDNPEWYQIDDVELWCHEFRDPSYGAEQYVGPAMIVEDPDDPTNQCVRVIVRSEDEARAAGNMIGAEQGYLSNRDSQFNIYSPTALEEGMALKLVMRVKATKNCWVSMNADDLPGSYNYWVCFTGSLEITTEWKLIELYTTVDSNMTQSANGKEFHTITLTLADYKEGVTFYFDDVGLYKESITENQGTTGDCIWHIDKETGVMTISGNGRMGDYSSGEYRPWNPHAFSDINTVLIEDGVTHIGDGAFGDFNNITSIKLPPSVTSIGNSAFENCCNNLTSVEIPSNVTSIGNRAFYFCLRLKSVTSYMEDPCPFGEYAFTVISSSCVLYVPNGTRDAYIAAGWTEEVFQGGIVEMEEEINITMTATADNVYYGEISPLSISMENDHDVIMTEFYMHLPDGVFIAKDNEGNYEVTLNSDRMNDYDVVVVENTPGVYHFLCYSPSNTPISGTEGELMTVNICQNDYGAGSFNGSLTSVLVSTADLNGHWLPDVSFTVNFLDYEMGDVNGDNHINGLDVVEIVNYIMGFPHPSQKFIMLAADFDKNGIINGMDLIEEVDLLMSQVEQQSVKAREGLNEMATLPSIQMRLGNNGENLSLAVESSDSYILAQYVLQLSDGQTLNGITTDANHIVAYKEICNNRYAVVCYSMRNAVFASNDNIMTCNIEGEGGVSVTDALFINADMQECSISPAVSGEATSLINIADDFQQPANIYSIGGQLIRKNATTTDNLPQGIYIINGKKYVRR